jgi:hypothetical protein
MSCENSFFVEKSEEKKDKYKNDKKKSSSTNMSTAGSKKQSTFEETVGKSIQRGRNALSQAEGHIKMFEEYLQSSTKLLLSREKSKVSNASSIMDDEMSDNVLSTRRGSKLFHAVKDDDDLFIMMNGDIAGQSSIENDEDTNVDFTNAGSFFTTTLSELEYSGEDDNNSSSSTDILDELVKNCEFRRMQDEGIMAVSSVPDIKEKHYGLAEQQFTPSGMVFTGPRPKRLFDPIRLSAHQRTGSNRVEKHKMGNKSVEQEEMYKPFKARPLPGGHFVNNDPYAMTKAALEKVKDKESMGAEGGTTSRSHHSHNKSRTTSSSLMASKHTKQVIDASVILGSTTSSSTMKNSIPFLSSEDNDVLVEQREHRQQERRTPNRMKESRVGKDIYDATTRLISQEFENVKSLPDEQIEEKSFYNADHDIVQDEEDILSLHQQIAKLQAELRQRRRKCFETIHVLEDETQCKSLKDIGIPEFQKIIGQGQQQEESSSGGAKDPNINVFNESSLADNDEGPMRRMGHHPPSTPAPTEMSLSVISSSTCADNNGVQEELHLQQRQKQQSLYLRQKGWLDDLDRKRKEAKDREIQELLRDITGKPNLIVTHSSWSKAKGQHDLLVQMAKKREEIKKQKKLEKENALRHLLHLKEMEKVQEEKASNSTLISGDPTTSADGGDKILQSHQNNKKKKVIDPQKQADYFNKLSQPLKRFKPGERPSSSSADMKSDSIRLSAVEDKEGKQCDSLLLTAKEAYCSSKNAGSSSTKTTKKSNRTTSRSINNNGNNNDVTPNDKITISFADMDDNEFAKVIQRILEQNAKKEAARQKKARNIRKAAEACNKSTNLLPHSSPYNSKK